jgi:uroporphyrinogen-III synthase
VRLLVTRPEPEASDLARRLTRLGHQVLVQPLMAIHLDPPPAELPSPAAIALTSRNAVRALASWPRATEWQALPVYAVGAVTAAAARQAGFSDVRVAAGDVAGLAALIRSDFDPRRGPLLHPAARHRSADLAELLPGLAVTTVEAYAAVAVPAFEAATSQALAAGSVDGVLLFSRRTSEVFAGLIAAAGLQPAIAGIALYALSGQVAEPLAALGAPHILVAPHPDEASLLALLDPPLAQD